MSSDWDGDGRFDLLVGREERDERSGAVSHGIFRYRLTTDTGELVFSAPCRLLTLPQPWRLVAFTVADWGPQGPPGGTSLAQFLAKHGRGCASPRPGSG